MPPVTPTPEQLAALVGSRHPITQHERPAVGLQPYYDWLITTLEQIADASPGHLRVARDDTSPLHVQVAAGDVRFGANARPLNAQVLDLSSYNNSTALLWVIESSGTAALEHADLADGWPLADHLKLAEVAIAAGAITQITDRRLDPIFTASS